MDPAGIISLVYWFTSDFKKEIFYIYTPVKSSHSHEDRARFIDCIDRSVLLEITPLVKFIRNYNRDPSDVFSRDVHSGGGGGGGGVGGGGRGGSCPRQENSFCFLT